MINIDEFKNFLESIFSADVLTIYEFKPDLQFVEIDCFKGQTYKLSIEISPEAIKISKIEKNSTLDFSLHDYIFKDIIDAQEFIIEANSNGRYLNPKL